MTSHTDGMVAYRCNPRLHLHFECSEDSALLCLYFIMDDFDSFIMIQFRHGKRLDRGVFGLNWFSLEYFSTYGHIWFTVSLLQILLHGHIYFMVTCHERPQPQLATEASGRSRSLNDFPMKGQSRSVVQGTYWALDWPQHIRCCAPPIPHEGSTRVRRSVWSFRRLEMMVRGVEP